MVQTIDTGILEGNDERRSGGTTTTEESGLIVTNEETNDGKRGNVDDGLGSRCEIAVKSFLDIGNLRYARKFP